MADEAILANRCKRGINTPTRISQMCRLRRAYSFTASPTRSSLDRFIPSRRNSDFESAYYKLMSPSESVRSDGAYTPPCPGSPASSRGSATREDNILTFSPARKTSSTGCMRSLERMCTELSLNTPKKARNKRYIPTSPDSVLDMPDIRNDFYTNVLDWSCTNNIAVALGNLVYSWNSSSGKCHLVPLNSEDASKLVCSLAWAPNGSHLALGLDNGHILLWDVDKDQLLQLKCRHTCTHRGGVDVLAWAPDESALYSGQNCGCVQRIDQRTGVTSFIKTGHTRGVCGLKVSLDGHYLASGGTDHQLHVWNIHQRSTHQQMRAHNASVKALAWCPWQSTILATGGGLGDGYIRIWNINSGSKLAEVNTHSQICCMVWSSRHREIVTGHGCESHDVTLWSYPQLRPVATLSAHEGRVLFLAISPDGKTLASCGADEMLMLWKCFDSEPPVFCRHTTSLFCNSPLTRTIR